MRLFVAVEAGEEVRQRLAQAQRTLRRWNGRVSWVAPENLHLTLKFLGETAEELLAAVQQAMSRACAEFGPMELEVRGVGQFPRVIWAGLEGNTEALASLAKRLDEELGALGFPREGRSFQPHLTLGRIKEPGDRQGLTTLLASLRNEPFGVIRVEAVHLYQSTLTPHGPHYGKLYTVQLKGANHGRQNGQG